MGNRYRRRSLHSGTSLPCWSPRATTLAHPRGRVLHRDGEGEIGFRSGEREVVLAAGGYITKPRNEVHAMWNAADVPARMIEVISPAGFENFFGELSEMLLSVSDPDVALIADLAGRCGLSFGQPEWLPDVISRFNLTPPPG